MQRLVRYRPAWITRAERAWALSLLVVGRRLHAARLVERQQGLGHRALLGDGEQAHPVAQDGQLVDSVERLRPPETPITASG